MKLIAARIPLCVALALAAAGFGLSPVSVPAQVPPPWTPWPIPVMPVPITTPDAQRQAMNSVRSRVSWLKNATHTAGNYATGADGLVYRSFVALRAEYVAFSRTLTPQQAAAGANELAELTAGLDILEEAFTNYRDDLGAGRPATAALRDLCQVIARGVDVWLAEFNSDCTRLRVGR